jgi:hypothetical protein
MIIMHIITTITITTTSTITITITTSTLTSSRRCGRASSLLPQTRSREQQQAAPDVLLPLMLAVASRCCC